MRTLFFNNARLNRPRSLSATIPTPKNDLLTLKSQIGLPLLNFFVCSNNFLKEEIFLFISFHIEVVWSAYKTVLSTEGSKAEEKTENE